MEYCIRRKGQHRLLQGKTTAITFVSQEAQISPWKAPTDGVEDQLLTIIAWGVQITHVAPQAVMMHQSPTTRTHAERGKRALQCISCECAGSCPSMIGLATLTSRTLCHSSGSPMEIVTLRQSASACFGSA